MDRLGGTLRFDAGRTVGLGVRQSQHRLLPDDSVNAREIADPKYIGSAARLDDDYFTCISLSTDTTPLVP